MRHVIALALAVFVTACASSESTDEPAHQAEAAADYASAWIGRNIAEMIEEYGEPSWQRDYVSDETPGAARWYDRPRSAGTVGRHTGKCFLDVLYDESGTIARAASSSSQYCGPPRSIKE